MLSSFVVSYLSRGRKDRKLSTTKCVRALAESPCEKTKKIEKTKTKQKTNHKD